MNRSISDQARAFRPALRVAIVVALMATACGAGPAPGQEPAPNSVNQGATPMDQIDLTNPEPGQVVVPLPEEPERRFPFLHDSKFSAQARSYYLYRDKYDDSLSEAWALGGSLAYKSGYLGDLFAVGAAAYTSQPLYAPDDRDGTLLLEPGQEGYTVLGQLYGEFKFAERIFGAVGRKEYNTPYLNKNDNRMTPNTFEGITAYGTAGGEDGGPAWRFGGGYISQIKERNADYFVPMSEDAGVDVDRGVSLGGANVEWQGFSFGAIDYYCHDIINIFYTEGGYALLQGEGYHLKLAAQFTDQRSTGQDLLTGDDFSTNQWGLKTDLGLGAALLTLGYTMTAGGDDMRSPWSGYPGYTSVQVEDFNRAGESAVILRAGYDFSSHGLKGLSAYTLWVHGEGTDAPAEDRDEVDFNVQWAPKTGLLRGMSYRVRYAYVHERSGGDPELSDFRFIVNYDFPRP